MASNPLRGKSQWENLLFLFFFFCRSRMSEEFSGWWEFHSWVLLVLGSTDVTLFGNIFPRSFTPCQETSMRCSAKINYRNTKWRFLTAFAPPTLLLLCRLLFSQPSSPFSPISHTTGGLNVNGLIIPLCLARQQITFSTREGDLLCARVLWAMAIMT